MKKCFFLGLLLLVGVSCNRVSYHHYNGKVFGTFFSVSYASDQLLDNRIDSALAMVNNSLSTFNKQSVISRINAGDDSVLTDSLFRKVFATAMMVSQQTKGAFDITVAPLVNAWGFGFDPQRGDSAVQVDSIMQYVGYRKVRMDEKGYVHKDDARLQLDASAIAKGFGCDCVAEALRQCGVKDFLVNIGGEMALQGQNEHGEDWHVGIEKALDDSLQTGSGVQRVVALSNCGVATSGNYRQYYTRGGKRVAHTIDPRTGYPVQGQVLSATVIAPSCMLADAYATAFMVLGNPNSIKNTMESYSDSIAWFLIVADSTGLHHEICSENFESTVHRQ